MKCSNCQEDVEKKHRRCPNCGAVNAEFDQGGSGASQDVQALKDEVAALKDEVAALKAKPTKNEPLL